MYRLSIGLIFLCMIASGPSVAMSNVNNTPATITTLQNQNAANAKAIAALQAQVAALQAQLAAIQAKLPK